MQQDPSRLPMVILALGWACIALSVVFLIAVGPQDHDPALSPAFISTGLTLLYTGWLYLARPRVAQQLHDRYVRWDKLAGIPYPVRGIFAIVVGFASVLVGVAALAA